MSFLLIVVMPTCAAAWYYGTYASDQYVSEFRFAVTDNTPQSSSVSGIASLLGGASSGSAMQNYIVTDYLTSRQAVDDLKQKLDLRSMFTGNKIDWYARFDPKAPEEKFLNYWQTMVTTSYDPLTGLATAKVNAFSPQDSYAIATSLVGLSEKLVNDIESRTQSDAVRFAQEQVRLAEQRLANVRAELLKYRSTEGLIDPGSSVISSNTQLASNMRADMLQIESQLAVLTNQQAGSERNPVAIALKARLASDKAQLARLEKDVSKNSKEAAALADVMAQYEKIDLERQYAQAAVVGTLQALDAARSTAAAQHLYLTPYVRPVLATSSIYPRRLLSIFVVAMSALGLWVLGRLGLRAMREHAV